MGALLCVANAMGRTSYGQTKARRMAGLTRSLPCVLNRPSPRLVKP
jgi:hypothetical protein